MANTATVVEQVQTLSDLVTVKYVLEKVVILEDAKWYGENRVLLLAHGIVKAGIDLKRITPDDVTISGKTICLHLPPPQIMDAYLDDKNSQVIDHATGLLRVFDKDLEQTARAKCGGRHPPRGADGRDSGRSRQAGAAGTGIVSTSGGL